MKFRAMILFALLTAGGAKASTNVQNMQLLIGATNTAILHNTLLSAGSFGGGTWTLSSGFGVSTSTWYRVATNIPYKYPFIAQINGTNFDAVSTNWLYWAPSEVGDGGGANYERLQYAAPIDTGGQGTNGGIIAYMSFGMTNLTSTQENYDLLEIDGSPFTILQGIYLNGTNHFIAHCGGTGATNGAYIEGVLTNKLYLVMLFFDAQNRRGLVRMWDPTNNFSLVGESVGYMGSGTINSAWRYWLQANYRNLDGAAYSVGTNWISSPLIFYGTSTNPPSPETNIVLSDFTTPFTPGTTVGVAGGIPVRSGTTITVTDAPYSADNTGATDAGGAINTAVASASSNDVVYLPAGLYKLTTQISVDKDGVELRGAGTNTILVGAVVLGHSSSGAEFFVITNGGTKGSSTIMVSNLVDTFGQTIAANDAFEISALWPNNDSTFPVISTTGGRVRIITGVVVVQSVSGQTLTLTKPLAFDYTNSAKIKSLNLTGNSALRFKRGVGISSLLISGTNSGLSSSAVNLLSASCLRDSYVTNVTVEYLNNYGLAATPVYNFQVQKSTFRHARTSGTSRSGITLTYYDGVLIQDCIFDDLTIGTQVQGGSGTRLAYAYNFHTNTSDKSFLLHSAHPIMTLVEGNVFDGNVVSDGYFGGASHELYHGNRFNITVALKRFVSTVQFSGNVHGPTDGSFRYTSYDSSYGTPYLIYEFGFPHIGNTTYTLTSPTLGFNYPGANVSNLGGGGDYTNFAPTFSATVTTNQLWTNMITGMLTFTNIPSDSANYPLVFQDATDTNRYWLDDLTTPVLASSAGTASNVLLNQTITISNGWKMYIAGSGAFNHLQTNYPPHILHGNLVYTNGGSSLVWDSTRLPRVIRASWLYDSAPVWFGTNRFPPMDPLNAAPIKTIPAQDRYSASALGTTPAISTGGRVTTGGNVKFQ